MAVITELGIKLVYALNTHCHADHITGSGELKKCARGCSFSGPFPCVPSCLCAVQAAQALTRRPLRGRRIAGLRSAIAKASGAAADVHFAHGDTLAFGAHQLEARV